MDEVAKIRHYQESTTPPDTWDEIGVMIDETEWETLPLEIRHREKMDKLLFNPPEDET
jgi:hypothetical protein